MDKAKDKLSGPGTILAVASGRFDRPAGAAKPPQWAIEPERSPEATELRTRFRKEFSIDRPVLADLVLIAAPEDRVALLADVIANLGHMVLEKSEHPESGGSSEAKPRRH